MKIEVHDPGKLILLALTIVCATVLTAIGVIDASVFGILVSGVTGYSFGNGRLAARGKTAAGMFRPKETDQ